VFKFSGGIPRKTMPIMLLAAAFFMVLAVAGPALSCDVAVVSGKYTTDGKPVLWKNFDCSSDWEQQVKIFPAKNERAGDYFLLYHNDDYMNLINNSPVMPQSGANAAGLAASVAAVYEDFSPVHEAGNLNTDLVQKAVEQCATLEDFENLLKTWPLTNRNRAISANYVVVDAQGGAALYECFTGDFSYGLKYIKYRKYDANTGEVTDDKGQVVVPAPADHPGFVNRTNLNNFVWYNSGVDRYLRAQDLLTDLAQSRNLNAQTLMQVVSKDVVGKQANNNGNSNYSTTYCISRNQTRSGTVFQGVKAGDDPLKSVFWTALGEPSVAVYVPHMIGAGGVTEYAYMDRINSDGTMQDITDNSLLTIAEDKLEISAGIHTSNRGSVLTGPYNKYINKNALARVQEWTIPLENTVIARTNEFISQLDRNPDHLTAENLWAFTSYCGKFIYDNYLAQSAEALPWAPELPGPALEDELTEQEEEDLLSEDDEGAEPGEDPVLLLDIDDDDSAGAGGSNPGTDPPADPGNTSGSDPVAEGGAPDLNDPEAGTSSDADAPEETPDNPGENNNDTPAPDQDPAAVPENDAGAGVNSGLAGNEMGTGGGTDAASQGNAVSQNNSVRAYDKSVLRAMIITSTTNITTAIVSTDGSRQAPSEHWVTMAERNAYQDAINKASLISQSLNVTQAEVNQAIIDLRAADAAFTEAKKPGTKPGMTLSGRVLYKERLYKPRYPLEDARIYFRSKGRLYEAYSDAQGYFKLETDAPLGFYTIYCEHPQYGTMMKLQYIGPLAYGEFLYIR
jgi:hypothetical protein